MDGNTLSILMAVFAAVAVIWKKYDEQAKQLQKLQDRFTKLLGRLAACRGVGCPFLQWSLDELDDDEEPPTKTISKSSQDSITIHTPTPA